MAQIDIDQFLLRLVTPQLPGKKRRCSMKLPSKKDVVW
jgi:hypothetical protein